jgi:hypothetical protein
VAAKILSLVTLSYPTGGEKDAESSCAPLIGLLDRILRLTCGSNAWDDV